MSKVYIKKGNNKSIAAKELLIELINDGVKLNNNVPIKVHFGEAGNETYIKPEAYDGIIDYLLENNVSTSFIETNVLYVGSRTTKTNHLKTALNHGFDKIPIIIADGEYGEDYDEVEINKDFFSHALIGKEFSKYNQFIVCSHFKGHHMAGFGGALKQLSMGFAARGGKLAMHSMSIPKVNESKCTACGICESNCPADAIEVVDYAVIDSSKCIGCAACISHCPEVAIAIDWGNNANFHKKVAEYAYAAHRPNSIYITFLSNITDNCDCMGHIMEPVIADVGVLASTDPAALDQACYDIVMSDKHTNPESKLWSYIERGEITLEHAVKIGIGERKYELIEK